MHFTKLGAPNFESDSRRCAADRTRCISSRVAPTLPTSRTGRTRQSVVSRVRCMADAAYIALEVRPAHTADSKKHRWSSGGNTLEEHAAQPRSPPYHSFAPLRSAHSCPVTPALEIPGNVTPRRIISGRSLGPVSPRGTSCVVTGGASPAIPTSPRSTVGSIPLPVLPARSVW